MKTEPVTELGENLGYNLVVLNQSARDLQAMLAEAQPSLAMIENSEELCLRIHRSTCSILTWLDNQKNYP